MTVDSLLSFSLRQYSSFKPLNLTADSPGIALGAFLKTENEKDDRVMSSGKSGYSRSPSDTLLPERVSFNLDGGDPPSGCRPGKPLFRGFSKRTEPLMGGIFCPIFADPSYWSLETLATDVRTRKN
jgi:hypothetical protein